jgi:hypothetical protein
MRVKQRGHRASWCRGAVGIPLGVASLLPFRASSWSRSMETRTVLAACALRRRDRRWHRTALRHNAPLDLRPAHRSKVLRGRAHMLCRSLMPALALWLTHSAQAPPLTHSARSVFLERESVPNGARVLGRNFLLFSTRWIRAVHYVPTNKVTLNQRCCPWARPVGFKPIGRREWLRRTGPNVAHDGWLR